MTNEKLLQQWSNALVDGFELPVFGVGIPWLERVQMCIAYVEQHVLTSPTVRACLENLPKGQGSICPNSPIDELVKYLGTLNARVSKADPRVNLGLARMVHEVFCLERRCMVAANAGSKQTVAQKRFFNLATKLASATDLLYLAWYDRMVVPHLELVTGWDKKKKQEHTDRLRELLGGPEFDYTIFDYDPATGTISNRMTWADTFPDIIDVIHQLLLAMATCAENDQITDYLLALADAYICTEVDELERLWHQTEVLWRRAPKTTAAVPEHGMEAYEHPICVSPHFRLNERVLIGRQIIEEVRPSVVAYAKATLPAHLAEQAERRLLGMDVSGFVSSLRGGMDLYLLISGQVVPNRRGIVEEQSVFNFLQVDAIATAAKRAHEYLTRHCAPDTAATLIPLVSFDGIFADTAAHEFSHPIACTPKVDKLLGPRSVVEEAKATIFGLVAISLVDSDRARQALAVSVYRVCRFLSREKRNDPSAEDYVRENMAMARCLLDAGVMRLTNTGLEVDIDNQRAVENWVNLMEHFAQQVIESYHDPKDPRAAIQKIVDEIEIFTASEPYLALIAWLDRDNNKSATN